MLTDGETGHQQIVITDGRIVSGPRVRTVRLAVTSLSRYVGIVDGFDPELEVPVNTVPIFNI